MSGTYQDGLTKDKKRAVRKRAQSVEIIGGEAFLKKSKGNVSVQ